MHWALWALVLVVSVVAHEIVEPFSCQWMVLVGNMGHQRLGVILMCWKEKLRTGQTAERMFLAALLQLSVTESISLPSLCPA